MRAGGSKKKAMTRRIIIGWQVGQDPFYVARAYRHKGALQNTARNIVSPTSAAGSAPARRRPPPPPRAPLKPRGASAGSRSSCPALPPLVRPMPDPRHPPRPHVAVARARRSVLVPLVPLIRQRASLALGRLRCAWRVTYASSLVSSERQSSSSSALGSPRFSPPPAAALPPRRDDGRRRRGRLRLGLLRPRRPALVVDRGHGVCVGAGRTPGVQMSRRARSANLAPSFARRRC